MSNLYFFLKKECLYDAESKAHSSDVRQIVKPHALTMYSHSVSAITAVVHRSGNGHNQRGDSIAHQVEVASARVLALKHLHQHDVELHPFQEHPGEGCQEEEMEQGREDCTGNLVWE